MSELGYLDNLRINDSKEKLVEVFYEVFKKNKKEAVELINDSKMSFPCLYLLLPHLEKLGFMYSLSYRNKIAIRIINQVLRPYESNYGFDYLGTIEKRVYESLKWIVETGYKENFCDDYEKVLDISSSVLVGLYEEKSILPKVAEMIFLRNRIGHYNHDLVWAFFLVHHPETLQIIAKYLLSDDEKDVTLASDLLGIDNTNNIKEGYDNYQKWIADNDPFLYFTGESFQLSSKPAICKVDAERKYLQKPFSDYEKKALPRLDDTEKSCLAVFSALEENEKEVLSNYSNQLHKKNASEWKNWLNESVEHQLACAKSNRGDYI